MTKSTITRERLEKIKSWRETYGAGSNVILPAEEAAELASIALAAMDSEPVTQDEREAFEAFMAKRFGDLVDQRRAKNGDYGYMAWDMVVAWTVWQARAAVLQAEPVTTANKLGNSPVIPDTWIPVSERLPEEGGRYWCYVEEQNSLGKSHYQWNCSWNGEIWGGAMMYGRVTHWMPMPAAPQEVGDA
ncbi:TPA: DUF551 domain-containing protein [Klebsiella aerogenes]|nr:DUF551 domain-containing protein [Klebsiella aerogenes]HCM7801572.1 DUF551 domain-containing protein [Klebsiella aerogenes]HCS4252639.1 DUF551 domain-containing protein [Klebsiella aerogenes]